MVVKRGFNKRQITLMGLIDSTTDKQTTALSTPMNVFWRCEPLPLTLASQGAINARLGLRFRESPRTDGNRTCDAAASRPAAPTRWTTWRAWAASTRPWGPWRSAWVSCWWCPSCCSRRSSMAGCSSSRTPEQSSFVGRRRGGLCGRPTNIYTRCCVTTTEGTV